VSLNATGASRQERPLPTLEDYSDGVSLFASGFLDDWKAGGGEPKFYAAEFEWRGPLPGDAMERVEAREPLEIAVYQLAAPSPGPSAGRGGSGAIRQRLVEIRKRFASLRGSRIGPERHRSSGC
jgi:hypothetical protein